RPRPGPASRLPHRQHRRRAPPPRRRAAVPRRRLQDEPARSLGGAAHRLALPARRPHRGDDGRPLPAPAPPLPRRPPPLPALAPAGLRPRDAPRRRALPLRPGDVRPRRPRARRRTHRRHGLAATGPARRRALRPPRRWAMSAEQLPADGDARLALRAPALLRRHNAAGTLAAADVHVAQRLGRLTGEADERVLLAVALAVRAVRAGSVCVDLDDVATLTEDGAAAEPDGRDAGALPWPEPAGWRAAIEASPVVAVGVDGPADRPARWVDGRLYLDRYWRDEQLVRREVDARLAAPVTDAPPAETVRATVRRLFPEPDDARQRLATAAAV